MTALCAEIRDLLSAAFDSIWVAGEVNRVRTSQRGHFYFELVEKGSRDDIVGKLEAVAWQRDFREIEAQLAQTDQKISEGQEIRCRGNLDFYPPFGRMQFVVREVDPVFSLGMLARRRRETLAALSASGLLERNRSLALPRVPLKIGLVTSYESAAYHDFLTTLRENRFGFEILFAHASVQGRAAEGELVSAIRWLGGMELDAIVLIRGGGSRADLAVFDSRQLAEAITRSTAPVLTGLGHQIDESIADLTAHTSLKTPTKAAEFLVDRVATSEREIAALAHRLSVRAVERLRRAREAMARAERGFSASRARLIGSATHLQHLSRALSREAARFVDRRRDRLVETAQRLKRSTPRHVAASRRQTDQLTLRIVSGSRSRLREWRATFDGWERLCVELAPQRTLERGFSMTRDDQGNLLVDSDQAGSGDRIHTQLASGELTSRVEGI